MRNLMLTMIILTTALMGAEGLFTLKTHLPPILQIYTSTAPQLSLEIKPLNILSFEVIAGYTYEEAHSGAGTNSLDVCQSSGEKSFSLGLLYNLIEKERSDFKVYAQTKFVNKSYLSAAFDRVGDDYIKVYASKWLKSVIYSIGFEPTLWVTDNFSVYTKFGLSAYVEPAKYGINSDVGNFPDDLVWEKVEESALRIGTTIETWMLGIGYTF